MSQEKISKAEPDSIYSTWLKVTQDFWDSTKTPWTEAKPEAENAQQDLQQQLNSMWQAFFKALNTPDPGSIGPNKFPEFTNKMMATLWSGILAKQAPIEGNGDTTEDFRSTIKRFSKSWFDLYEKEFRQILNIPQLGMTRFYQEHAVKAVEEFNDFQAAISQFVNLLSGPLIETIQVARKEIETARQGGEDLVKDSKAQYQTWIQKLETAYLDLLRSQEFTSTLSEVMKALRDYRTSKQQLLIDLLQDLPVPTHKDMDELYREIYVLKKRVKELEKRGKKNG